MGTSENLSKNLADVLNIVPATDDPVMTGQIVSSTPTVSQQIQQQQASPMPKDESDDDFSEVRANVKTIIDKSTQALDGMLEVAESCNEPRAYEVVAELLRTAMEANDQLMQAHKTLAEIKKNKNGGVKITENITNNSIFVGSTSELQKFMKERKKKDKELPGETVEEKPANGQ